MTDETSPALTKLLTRAKRLVATRGTKAPAIALLNEVTAALEATANRAEEIRREAFLDGVRSAAKVVRDKKEALRPAADAPVQAAVTGEDVHDEVADRILDVAQEGDVTLKTLKDLLARTETASGDLTALDADLIRVYYSLVNRHHPSAADVLPAGRPTASIDVALAMARRLMPEGWWSLGANFAPGREPPTALVGLSAEDNPKPRTAATPALALLTALLSSLVASASGKG